MKLSVVIPAYNEQDNVYPLYKELKPVLARLTKDYEIIFVDDGSRDHTFSRIRSLHAHDKRVHAIRFRRNFGQGAALDAGFKRAKGDIVVYMDADLQTDPRDIPTLIRELKKGQGDGKGYDAVIGWRWKRHDPFGKRIASGFANWLRKSLTGERIHDAGCPLKVIRKDAAKALSLTGEMHRYVSTLLLMQGYRVGEVKISHRPRYAGKTKYGAGRLFRGLLDLLLIKFWLSFSGRPIHLFGGAGLLLFLLGFITGIYMLVEKFVYGQAIAGRPMLLLTVLMVVLGVQFFFFGIIADILVKLYREQAPSYSIEQVI